MLTWVLKKVTWSRQLSQEEPFNTFLISDDDGLLRCSLRQSASSDFGPAAEGRTVIHTLRLLKPAQQIGRTVMLVLVALNELGN